jgi:hypothetical protein
MSAPQASRDESLKAALRQELFRLARNEENVADREAGNVRYWEPMPVDVAVHQRCACVLRAAADQLLVSEHSHGR